MYWPSFKHPFLTFVKRTRNEYEDECSVFQAGFIAGANNSDGRFHFTRRFDAAVLGEHINYEYADCIEDCFVGTVNNVRTQHIGFKCYAGRRYQVRHVEKYKYYDIIYENGAVDEYELRLIGQMPESEFGRHFVHVSFDGLRDTDSGQLSEQVSGEGEEKETECRVLTCEERTVLVGELGRRLACGVMCDFCGDSNTWENTGRPERLTPVGLLQLAEEGLTVIPYLRPLSDITDSERRELSKRYMFDIIGDNIHIRHHSQGCWDDDTEARFNDYKWLVGWLDSHHFDHNGLIKKGLAETASEDMYTDVKNNKNE